MCLACEQDAMWYPYLRRRGLLDENRMPVEPVPSVAYPVEALMPQQPEEKVQQSASEPTEQHTLPFDAPTAG